MPYPSEHLYPSEDLFPGGPEPAGVRPTLDELAGIVRARTRRKSNGLRGSFEDDTYPTKSQATDLITQALNETFGNWPELTPETFGLARQVTLYRAALLVEQNYFPELAHADDGTARDELREDWVLYFDRLDLRYNRARPNKTVGSIMLASPYGGGTIEETLPPGDVI